MKTKIIEATNRPDGINYGKFLVAQFDEQEWAYPSALPSEFRTGRSLLKDRGWDDKHVFVLDLQTGEGAIFRQGGLAPADLNKHCIWVCPLYEPFLTWLYKQDISNLDALPALVELEADSAWQGYRRTGGRDGS